MITILLGLSVLIIFLLGIVTGWRIAGEQQRDRWVVVAEDGPAEPRPERRDPAREIEEDAPA